MTATFENQCRKLEGFLSTASMLPPYSDLAIRVSLGHVKVGAKTQYLESLFCFMTNKACQITERPMRDRDELLVTAYSQEMLTLRQCGARFGISAERVRQILNKKGAAPRRLWGKRIVWTPELRLARRKARFWSLIDITADPNECWVYKGYCQPSGYGVFSFKAFTKSSNSHVIAYMLSSGHKPNKWVLHRCDNPPCCNPNHLYDGTPKDNSRDRERRGRGAGARNLRKWHAEHSRLPNHARKLTTNQVKELRLRRLAGERATILANDFGIHVATVYHIVNGSRYKEAHV